MRTVGIYLSEADTLLAEPAQVYRFVLICGEMRIDAVHRHIFKACGRHADTSLRKRKHQSYSLCHGGLSSPVRTGEDIDSILLIEHKVIYDDIGGVFDAQSKLQILKALCVHRGLPFADSFGGCELEALCRELFDELGKADIVSELGDKACDIYDRNVNVL